jgi:hypothetical protein
MIIKERERGSVEGNRIIDNRKENVLQIKTNKSMI